MQQRAMILEIEARPEQAGKIYASATDAESRLNEALHEGWRVSAVHAGGAHAKAAVSIVILERD